MRSAVSKAESGAVVVASLPSFELAAKAERKAAARWIGRLVTQARATAGQSTADLAEVLGSREIADALEAGDLSVLEKLVEVSS